MASGSQLFRGKWQQWEVNHMINYNKEQRSPDMHANACKCSFGNYTRTAGISKRELCGAVCTYIIEYSKISWMWCDS